MKKVVLIATSLLLVACGEKSTDDLIKDKNMNPFKKGVIDEQNLKMSQKLFQRSQNSHFMHFGVAWKNSYNYQIKKTRNKSWSCFAEQSKLNLAKPSLKAKFKNFKIEKDFKENMEVA